MTENHNSRRRNILKTLGVGASAVISGTGIAGGSEHSSPQYGEFTLTLEPTGEKWDDPQKQSKQKYEIYSGDIMGRIWDGPHAGNLWFMFFTQFIGPLPEEKDLPAQPVIWDQRRDFITSGQTKQEFFASITNSLHNFDELNNYRVSSGDIEAVYRSPFTDSVGVEGNFRLTNDRDSE